MGFSLQWLLVAEHSPLSKRKRRLDSLAHSSVLAWRIPGMVEPGGLPSMGSHGVGQEGRGGSEEAVPGPSVFPSGEPGVSGRDGVSREVPCSALKGETVPDSLPATPKSPPPSPLPTPSPWVIPVHQPQASSIVHPTWTGNSFHT